MNTGTEILNQVMNRWVSDFRAAQMSQVMNEKTIKNLGLFDLCEEERAALAELNAILDEAESPQAWA